MDKAMLSNFIVALSAVVPVFCLMSIGAFVKWRHWLTDEELNHMNRMVFRVFFSCLLFHSIYTTELVMTFRPKLILFGAGGVIIVFALMMILIPRLETIAGAAYSSKQSSAVISC